MFFIYSRIVGCIVCGFIGFLIGTFAYLLINYYFNLFASVSGGWLLVSIITGVLFSILQQKKMLLVYICIIGGILGWFISAISAEVIIYNIYYLDVFGVRTTMFIGISCGALVGLWVAKKLEKKSDYPVKKDRINAIYGTFAIIAFYFFIRVIAH